MFFVSKAKSGFGFFSFYVFVSNLGLGFFFCEPNLLGFFWCFVAEIFRFAKFIYGFAKFLGFVGFFYTDWFVRGIRLDGKKIAKKMLIVKKITCIFYYSVICDFGIVLISRCMILGRAPRGPTCRVWV